MTATSKEPLLQILGRNIASVTLSFAAAIFLLFWPQSIFYRGLYWRLAELQFYWLGDYLPMLTLLFPVLLLTLLILLVLIILSRLRRKNNAQAQVQSGTSFSRVVRSQGIIMWSFSALALGCVLAAIGSLAVLLNLPTMVGKRQEISIGTLPIAVKYDGPARLTGAIDWQKLSGLDNRRVIARRKVYFAPITLPGSQPKSYRYFIQVFRPEFILPPKVDITKIPERKELIQHARIIPTVKAPVGSVTGILLRQQLPSEIVWLYRKAGVQVHPDNYVLYRNVSDMRWKYWVAIAEFLLIGAAALLIALYTRRQRRRLKSAALDS